MEEEFRRGVGNAKAQKEVASGQWSACIDIFHPLHGELRFRFGCRSQGELVRQFEVIEPSGFDGQLSTTHVPAKTGEVVLAWNHRLRAVTHVSQLLATNRLTIHEAWNPQKRIVW